MNFLDIAKNAARIAGNLIAAAWTEQREIMQKASFADLVTDTDKRSEKAIRDYLRTQVPDHAIVGEEEGGAVGALYTWFIDALDGTTNFVHGYPHCSVSIALCGKDGSPVVGVVFNPLAKELFCAERDRGSWLNGQPLTVTQTTKLSDCLVATGFPYDIDARQKVVGQLGKVLPHVQDVRSDGSAALDLCYVAAGRIDAFWEDGLKAWDTAAGALIVKEAGGLVTSFASDPYRPANTSTLATNGIIHAAFLKHLH